MHENASKLKVRTSSQPTKESSAHFEYRKLNHRARERRPFHSLGHQQKKQQFQKIGVDSRNKKLAMGRRSKRFYTKDRRDIKPLYLTIQYHNPFEFQGAVLYYLRKGSKTRWLYWIVSTTRSKGHTHNMAHESRC